MDERAALSHPQYKVRLQAVRRWAGAEQPTGLEASALLPLLDDPHPAVRREALALISGPT